MFILEARSLIIVATTYYFFYVRAQENSVLVLCRVGALNVAQRRVGFDNSTLDKVVQLQIN